MKITDSNLNGITNAAQQAVQSTQSAGAKNGAQRTGEARDDRVSLSNLSSTLKALSSGSPEREARVDQIAATYQSGNYSINSMAVGQSMVADALGAR